MAKCEAITQGGNQCTRNALEGSKYCKQHQDYDTKKEGKKSEKKEGKKSEKKEGKKGSQKIEKFFPNKDQSFSTLAEELYEHGVTIITDTWLSENLDWLDEEFDRMLGEMPEFKVVPDRPVLGGFSALGNPSSFHHILIRRIRQWAMWHVAYTLGEYKKIEKRFENYKLEQIPDRLMYRPPGIKVGAETWHRDEAVNVGKNDLTFGGWQNFDHENQYFSCVIDTHVIGQREKDTGFVKLTKDEVENFSEDPDRRHIVVPPGAIILFNENIVHEVIPIVVRDRYVKRLFLGWRLTDSDAPMFSDNEERFDTQRSFRIKSGQETAMWPQSAWLYAAQRHDMIRWSHENFVDEVLVEHTFKPGKPDQETFTCVERYMRGLDDYGLPLHEEYDDNELAIYTPGTEWEILVDGSDDQYGKLYLNEEDEEAEE
jgi:hypothetical protein